MRIEKLPNEIRDAILCYAGRVEDQSGRSHARAILDRAILQWANTVRESAIRECLRINYDTAAPCSARDWNESLTQASKKMLGLLPGPKEATPTALETAVAKLRSPQSFETVQGDPVELGFYFNEHEHKAILAALEPQTGEAEPAPLRDRIAKILEMDRDDVIRAEGSTAFAYTAIDIVMMRLGLIRKELEEK